MLNALSIDLEDWFHLLDVESAPPLEEWARLESRVERNTRVFLTILERHRVRATFFVLGWIAERFPGLVRELAEKGHEIASHGYGHKLVYASSPAEFESDILKSWQVISAASGRPVLGYRAPGFSVNGSCLWAFDVLARHGFLYDSSIFPSLRGHGGFYGYSTQIVRHACADGAGLWEIPISVLGACGLRIAFCGGGYFRFFPAWLMRWGIRRLNRRGLPAVIYLHPRDLDASQPRIEMPFRRRWKCYVNLQSTAQKLEELLREFRFGPMVEVLQGYLSARGEPALLPHCLPAFDYCRDRLTR
jgi:polysaccharide deacetylase family protein (PEP-CTERM system associated)